MRDIESKRKENGYLHSEANLAARCAVEMFGTCAFVFFGAGCAAQAEKIGLLAICAAHGTYTKDEKSFNKIISKSSLSFRKCNRLVGLYIWRCQWSPL
jgi:hypothetical protein